MQELTSRGLLRDSTSVLKAWPGKLDQKTQTWYSIDQLTLCFSLQTSDFEIIFDFFVDYMSLATSFKKVQPHHDWIKEHAVRLTPFIRQRATMQLICEVTDKY